MVEQVVLALVELVALVVLASHLVGLVVLAALVELVVKVLYLLAQVDLVIKILNLVEQAALVALVERVALAVLALHLVGLVWVDLHLHFEGWDQVV